MNRNVLLTTSLIGSLALSGCSKSVPESAPPPAGNAPSYAAPTSVEAGMPVPNLTQALGSKFGLTQKQAEGGVGSVLAYAEEKLSPADYSKVAATIPGASSLRQSAEDQGAVTGPLGDVAGLNAALGKLGISPEIAKQFVPQVTDYVAKLAGPEVGGLLKGLFQ